jgi:LysM repeat protein
LTILSIAGFPLAALQAQEDTYAISLVKTAVADKDVYPIDGKKVRTESYTVRKGDYLWRLFRKKKLFNTFDANELLRIFKQLNPNLGDPNLIYPGQKVFFPQHFVSSAVETDRKAPEPVRQPGSEELKKARYEIYTVKPGDSLSYVAMKRFNIPRKYLYRHYLKALADYNPEIRNINTVLPGMVVKLPVYYPEKGVLAAAGAESGDEQGKIELLPPAKAAIKEALKIIFTQMGEEWRQHGQHFIPLQSGGQVNLGANSFPMISLRNGRRIVIDARNKLPGKMAGLIESSWQNYRVVHLDAQDEIRTALSKILPVCGYAKLIGRDQPLELGGDIGLRIQADWIVIPSRAEKGSPRGVFVLCLRQKDHSAIPATIKRYLDGLDIKAIEYPPIASRLEQQVSAAYSPEDLFALIERLLELLERPLSKRIKIPIYDNQKTDYNLIIEADFFLKLHGKDAIINLGDLDQKVIDFLQTHRFQVLTLADEKEPLELVKKTLKFLDKDFVEGPHTFQALPKDDTRNIEIIIDGLIFSDHKDKSVLVSPRRLPQEIVNFLAGSELKVIRLPAY